MSLYVIVGSGVDGWERLVRDKAREFTDGLIEPLKWLANDLLEGNIYIWLKNPTHWDTIGAESVRQTGFTTNQRNWLITLDTKFKLKKKPRKSCDDCFSSGESWFDDVDCNVCMQETMRATSDHPKYKKEKE